ncbi:unnamed protein product [Calicophoron daubneyi]|uniref:Nicastrin n=1 Tax=Calicophoron daubneyi TaxID=300641 RepID=A0AAV2TY23_CALDB
MVVLLSRSSLVLVVLCSLALRCVEQSSISESIYHYAPEDVVSYCSRKLNISGQVGCSSKLGVTSGVVIMANNSAQVATFLNGTRENGVILVVNFDVFINASLMEQVRRAPHVVGLVIFSPERDWVPGASGFSESPTCPNALYSLYSPDVQCNFTPSWNPFGADYSTIDWPFPAVLVQNQIPEMKVALADCYHKFNVNPADDTRCSMELRNPMSAVRSTVVCTRRQSLMSLQIFETSEVFCEELTGLNIVLSTTNTTASLGHPEFARSEELKKGRRAVNSSLLVMTRMDSRSMFERSGFGSQGILPSVAVLLSVAIHLMRQPAFKDLQLERDLFFAFLDNEAYDFMGSNRLNYDLREYLLAAYTGYSLGWDQLYGVIELGEISLSNSTDPVYQMLSDSAIYDKTKTVTDRLRSNLIQSSERFGKIRFVKPTEQVSRMPLPPTVSMQRILYYAPHSLAHLVLTDAAGPPLHDTYFESFLDVNWPPKDNPGADATLLSFANTLADALHREVTTNAQPIPASIEHPTPGDLLECFVHTVNCSLLKMFLSPMDINFLLKLGTPIPTQTYTSVNKHELKLSHIVNVLLMGLTGQLTEEPNCPSRTEKDPYVYLMGYFNGSERCYRTLLDFANRFVMFQDGEPIAPAWVRSRVATNHRYLRWYRSASRTIDIISVALGLLFMVLTGVCAFFLRSVIDVPANNILNATGARDVIPVIATPT